MTHIRELFHSPTLSFEFFPPRTETAKETLLNTFEKLSQANPDFVSVTYGAMGSTRDTTKELVIDFSNSKPFPAMAHLTCVGHSHAEINMLLDEYAAAGVDNLLALSGDPIEGGKGKSEFNYAMELVELVRAHPHDFTIGVAAHPEVHPRSKNKKSDRKHLAEKLKLADFAITQFFFNPQYYFQLVEELGELGNDKPIIAGVIPVVNTESIRRFSNINKVNIDEELMVKLDAIDDPSQKLQLAISAAQEMCEELLAGGAAGIHIYTLNQHLAPLAVANQLGLHQIK